MRFKECPNVLRTQGGSKNQSPPLPMVFPFGAWPKGLPGNKENRAQEWSRLAMRLIAKENERRGPQHAEQATKLIETAGSFARSFK